MKKLIKILSLIVFICLIMSIHYSCQARYESGAGGVALPDLNEKKSELDTSILSSRFTSELKPDGTDGNAESFSTPFVELIQTVVNSVLGVVQIIGGVLMIVSIALYGIGMLISGNEHLAHTLGLESLASGPRGGGRRGPEVRFELLNFGRILIIGSVLLFSSATIVKFVFKIFNA